MPERKHADLWKELVDEAGEDEIDRAASVSVEQAEAELRAAGFDVEAERAKARAFLDELEGGAPTATATATPPRTPTQAQRRPVIVWLAAAATFGLVAGGALNAALRPGPVAQPAPQDVVAAERLRGEAAAACNAEQWSVCLAKLDEARAADPRGDDVLAVKSLRDKAIAGILKKQPTTP
jgi:hypothetical protein